jgi:hypothetical protein
MLLLLVVVVRMSSFEVIIDLVLLSCAAIHRKWILFGSRPNDGKL